MDNYLSQLFGLFILSMGAWMIYLGRASAKKLELAKHWPTATAKIIHSEVHKMPGSNARFRFRIKYQYRVNDQEYTNDKIAIGGEITSGRTLAEKRQTKYPHGSSHEVFYNPANVEEAFLEPTIEGGGNIELMGGIVSILIGILLIAGLIG